MVAWLQGNNKSQTHLKVPRFQHTNSCVVSHSQGLLAGFLWKFRFFSHPACDSFWQINKWKSDDNQKQDLEDVYHPAWAPCRTWSNGVMMLPFVAWSSNSCRWMVSAGSKKNRHGDCSEKSAAVYTRAEDSGGSVLVYHHGQHALEHLPFHSMVFRRSLHLVQWFPSQLLHRRQTIERINAVSTAQNPTFQGTNFDTQWPIWK